MTPATFDPLFLNHLAFLGTHRGDVEFGDEGVSVASEMPGFSTFTPSHPGAALPEGTEAVRLVPESGEDWAHRLPGLGFAPAEILSYRALSGGFRSEAQAGIRAVQSDKDAAVFADTQARGFDEPGSPDFDQWANWMRRAALANWRKRDQSFFIAYVGEEPGAVTLTVRTEGIAGVYAVATRPQFRKKGLATALLARVSQEATAAGFQRLALQVAKGSDAERLYGHLGFAEAYQSQVWRRPAGSQ